METINELLSTVKVQGQTNSLTSSKQSLAVLDEENVIIEKKYAAKQIRQMNDQELSLWPKALLLKIHVITGSAGCIISFHLWPTRTVDPP